MLDGKLPVNHAILGNLQDVFNLLPNLSTPKAGARDLPLVNSLVNGSVGVEDGGAGAVTAENTELARAMSIKTNDQLMSIYLSSLIRAITAFHDLIENKIQNKRTQEDEDAKLEEEKKEKEVKKEEKLMVNGTGEKADKETKEGAAGDKEEKGKKKS